MKRELDGFWRLFNRTVKNIYKVNGRDKINGITQNYKNNNFFLVLSLIDPCDVTTYRLPKSHSKTKKRNEKDNDYK